MENAPKAPLDILYRQAGKPGWEPIKLTSNGVEFEPNQKKLDVVSEVLVAESPEAPSPRESAEIPEINFELEALRTEYLDALISYEKLIRQKRTQFQKTVSSLGVDKQLPTQEMSKELKDAESDYRKMRGRLSIDDMEKERNLFRRKLAGALSPTERNIEEKALSHFDSLPIIGRGGVSQDMMIEGGITSTTTENGSQKPLVDGIFVSKKPVIEEKVIEAREPEQVTVIEPESEPVIEHKHVILPETTVEEEIIAPIMPDESQVEVKPEPESKPKPAASSIIKADEAKPEDFKMPEYPEGITFPVDFKGGEVKVVQGNPEDGNVIKVLLNGEVIATGLVTDKGPEVKLEEKYEHKGFSRFFFESTIQQKAFKAAKPVFILMKKMVVPDK